MSALEPHTRPGLAASPGEQDVGDPPGGGADPRSATKSHRPDPWSDPSSATRTSAKARTGHGLVMGLLLPVVIAAVPLQVERPAAVPGDALAHALPALTVPLEVTVLQLDAGPVRVVWDEGDLDLA